MTEALEDWQDSLERDGFVIRPRVLSSPQLQGVIDGLTNALARDDSPSTLRSRGKSYGSRNLIDVFPDVVALTELEPMRSLITAVLGPQAGLVRLLFFDKPPGRTWSLPWHRDRTIAVERNDLPSDHFSKPTTKAGIPHVEAPEWLLQRMITLRLHLDAMHAANGPLAVIPGSHLVSQTADRSPIELHADAGDVLVMRPLLSHASSASHDSAVGHRRILHFEFAASRELPDGYQWRQFLAPGSC